MPKKGDYELALIAWCPWCKQLPGSPCYSGTGRERLTPHRQRVMRARVVKLGTIRLPLRPGEPDNRPPVDDSQLPLVGYES